MPEASSLPRTPPKPVPLRARVLDLLHQEPGMTVQELALELGRPPGAVYDTLAELREDERVGSVGSPRRCHRDLPVYERFSWFSFDSREG